MFVSGSLSVAKLNSSRLRSGSYSKLVCKQLLSAGKCDAKLNLELDMNMAFNSDNGGNVARMDEDSETFQAVFCRQFDTPEACFERRLILFGVPALNRPFIRFMWLMWPDIFRMECEYLAPLRSVRSRRQFLAELGGVEDYNQYVLPFWRAILGLRISVRRLTRLRKLLPEYY